MRKAALGVVAVLVLLVAALLVAPSFIDWNNYRPQIAQKIGEATGREVTLAGPLTLAILPAPTVTARDVRVANVPGAAEPDMIRLAALDLRLALLPLLSGRVVATSVTLDRPTIELEKFADGRNNWTVAKAEPAAAPEPAAPPSGGAQSSAAPAKRSGEVALSIDRLNVKDGVVVYRTPGGVERVEKLDAAGRIGGTSGPLAAKGSLALHGARLAFDINIGRLGTERVPARAWLDFGPGATAELAGDLVEARQEFAGTAKLATADLGAALRSAGVAAPGWSDGRRVGIDGTIAASTQRIALNDLSLGLDDARAGGSLAVTLGADPEAVLKLVVNQLDLDKLAAAKPAAPPPAAAAPASAAPSPPTAAAPTAAAPTLTLPTTLRGSVDLSAEVLVWRGAVVRQSRVQATLAGGVLSLDRVGAVLPGGSDVSFSGSARPAAGGIALDGDVEAESDNLRGLLDWLGIASDGVPADRLRKASLASHVVLAADQLALSGLDLSVDATRLTGAATVALRERPGIGARVAIDRLNLDAYLPGSPEKPAAQQAAAPPAANARPAAPVAPAASGPAPAPLARFDANLELGVGTLSWRGQTVEGLRLAAALQGGDVTVREASAKDIAGSEVKLTGLVRDAGGASPQLQLAFDARGPAFERTLRAVAPGASVPALGAFTLSGEAQGEPDAIAFEGELAIAGGKLHAAGERKGGALSPVSLDLTHPEASRLLAALAPSYRPPAALGPLAVSTRLEVADQALHATDLDVTLGKLALKGDLTVRTDGPRPVLAGTVNFGDLVLERFLPVRQAAVTGAPSLPPGVLLAQAGTRASEPGRWSRERLDLAALGLVDADLKLTGETLAWGKWRLDKPDIALHLKDAVLGVERLAGGLFGGTAQLDGQLAGGATPEFKLALQLRDADLREALAAAGGGERIDGRGDLDMTLGASGASPAELVSHLDGDGRLDGRDGTIAGIDMRAISDRLKNLDRLTDLLDLARSGGHGETRFSHLTGTFKAENGIVRSNDLKLEAEASEGTATAVIDLPRWTIQSRVSLRLVEHRNAPPIAMTLDGPLDNPRKVFDVNPLQGFINQLGVGRLFQQGRPGESAPSGPLQKPERAIENLLKGLGR